jgi:hypothetical protein
MLIEGKHVQPELFDERNLFGFTHSDYPGERPVAGRNRQPAKLRAHKREDILQATERDLEKIASRVQAGPARTRLARKGRQSRRPVS